METTGCFTSEQLAVKDAIEKICSQFPDEYWRERDMTGVYPKELHAALAKDGWLGIALPEELGGAGLGISEATMMMQTISQSGAGMSGCQSIHANVYATQPISKFATPSQRHEFLPKIISGEWRTCFGVTEPNTGLDTLKLRTVAEKTADGSQYLISGQKIWITSAQVASRMVLLARTTPLEQVDKPSHGLSLFYIPFAPNATTLSLTKIAKMGARAVDANEVFFAAHPVPASSLIGRAGAGFGMILHGMNAERCLLAGEALGLGYAALTRAARYARDRVVFARPIGQNQGVAHPLADAWTALEAAKHATYHAARLYDLSTKQQQRKDSPNDDDDDDGETAISAQAVGVACNTAKHLAATAAFRACERAVLAHGGMGYAAEFDVERYMRECFIPRIAPVSSEMILNYIGEKVLGLPRSY